MWAEQAIFTSLRTSTSQGYHLVAQSAGIDEELARQLRQWSPSHGSLLDADVRASSVNGFCVGTDWVVVSRTLYGGPEYSGRGALQIVTLILAVRPQQLAGFDQNLLVLARTARILGHLRLPEAAPQRLPQARLPERALQAAWAAEVQPVLDDAVLERALQLLRQGHRVAVVGVADPGAAVEQILRHVPPAARAGISFTTGLTPSQNRPFRLHALPQVDAAMHRRLAAQDIRFVAPNV